MGFADKSLAGAARPAQSTAGGCRVLPLSFAVPSCSQCSFWKAVV